MQRALPRLQNVIMGSRGPRNAFVHAMQPSIVSSLPAFKNLWPEAKPMHLMDDSLAEYEKHTGLSEDMKARFLGFARYAPDNAVCQEAQRELHTENFPVLKLNEAMMNEASKLGQSRKGIVAVFSMFNATLPSISRELQDIAGGNLNLQTHYIDGALEALVAGEEEECCRIIAENTAKVVAEVGTSGENISCVVFAMFSMARARKATEESLRSLSFRNGPPPVLTSPEAAVLQLKGMLTSSRC